MYVRMYILKYITINETFIQFLIYEFIIITDISLTPSRFPKVHDVLYSDLIIFLNITQRVYNISPV